MPTLLVVEPGDRLDTAPVAADRPQPVDPAQVVPAPQLKKATENIAEASRLLDAGNVPCLSHFDGVGTALLSEAVGRPRRFSSIRGVP